MFDEIVVFNHPIFAHNSLKHIGDLHRIAVLVEEIAPLPSFVTFAAPRPVSTLLFDKASGSFSVEGRRQTHETAEAAYDTVSGNDVHFGAGMDDPEVGEIIGGMLMVKPDPGAASSPMLISSIETDDRDLAVSNWFGFLKTARQWMEHQGDWLLAHNFVQGHPALWHRPYFDRDPDHWEMAGGTAALWMNPFYNEAGEIVVMSECGAAAQPHRVMHHHDERMNVYATSVEAAYLQTAALLHELYDLDGSDRFPGRFVG